MPARSDLDPREVPRLLPNIGLIDIGKGLDAASFRLAGTCLRDIYGREITGERVDDVFAGEASTYWRRIHARIVDRGLPLHGVVRSPAPERDHILLFWLRLPLSEDGRRVDRILCHDMAAPGDSDRMPERTLLAHARYSPTSNVELRRVQCG
jgi:hypothetical protein